MDVSELLVSAAEYLQEVARVTAQDDDPIEISESLLQEIKAASNDVKKELECKSITSGRIAVFAYNNCVAIESQIKSLTSNIHSQFSDLRTIPYRLHSVFIHRGYVNSGHYWIYIYDFGNKMWRKYNDGYVTEVKDTTEIFERDPEVRPATPYFLVYIKDEFKNELVDPVCRDIVETPHESPDAEMIDISDDSQDQPDLVELKSFPKHSRRIVPATIPGWDSSQVETTTNW